MTVDEQSVAKGLYNLQNIRENSEQQVEILQSVMHPKTESKSKKLALETLVKEQEIFELIEPSTDINDVVLDVKVKKLLDAILKQVDRRVLARLSSWGIKSRDRKSTR